MGCKKRRKEEGKERRREGEKGKERGREGRIEGGWEEGRKKGLGIESKERCVLSVYMYVHQ